MISKELCLVVVLAVLSLTVRGDESAPKTAINPNDAVMIEARHSQDSIDKVTEEMMRKLTDLEIEYHKKKVPLFNQRNEVLAKVKGFWPRVIENHPSHESWFRDIDKEALQYLVDVQVKDIDDGNDSHLLHHYRLELHFSANSFFSNAVLWRDIRGHAHDDESEVSGVTWFEGRIPTDVSFFNFFEKPNARANGVRLEQHFVAEIGHVFRYEFWPNPFTYHDLPQYQELLQQHHNGDVYGGEEAPEYDPSMDHEIQRESVEADPIIPEEIGTPEL